MEKKDSSEIQQNNTISLTGETAAMVALLAEPYGISINECVECMLTRLQTVCQSRSQNNAMHKHLLSFIAESRKNYPKKRIEYVELEEDVRFVDRRKQKRCFYVRAVIPLFIHEEELFVQAAGEPEFKLILRDCQQKTGEHDLEDFTNAVKSTAVSRYEKMFFA
jgi:hypothetical protein